MTWTTVGTIKVQSEWKFTPIVEGHFFRIRNTEAGQVYISARQAEFGDYTQFWTHQRILVTPNYSIFQFTKPPFFTERRIALQISPPSRAIDSKTLLLEVSDMPISNPASTQITMPSSATVNATSVVASAASVSLLAANTNRKCASIWNNSTATLRIELGATASATAFTVMLDPGGFYELPIAYTGAISGIWSAANGSALVREFV